MIVGEAPGRIEDEKGRPFAGPSGVLLWRELERVGIDKRSVFAANAVSCFPARTPTEDEVYACRGNLYTQAWICKPKFILALGRTANSSLGNLDLALGRATMGQICGQWYDLGWFKYDPCRVMPTYHPAAILRNGKYMRAWRTDLRAFAEKAVSG
jgi:DNA polymerase